MDLVDRCLGRDGRFLSDMVHLLEDYRADESGNSSSKLEEERDILKGEKKKLENDLIDARSCIAEISKANSAFRTKISELELTNDSLKKESEGVGSRLVSAETSLGEEKKKREALEVEVVALHEKNEALETDNLNLKLEVEKGVEEIAGALGNGYGRCLNRMKMVGYDVEGHGFDDYIRDFAEETREKGADP
ncbi:uncharacterized protein LOC141707407 [Apium graveolens]|uniref:uncharacterized protein LOC141707407 n=1 Tax=Apium graveolens TaxID=4045 RepID=UPI003D7BB5D9